jgi:signal transduction histidine kinase/CheY-like chemotaxis protein
MRGTPDAYPFPTFPAPLRFAIPLAAVAIVFVVDHLSGWPVDEPSKFLLLGIAVMASAWFAGTGPALAATVLGAVLGASETRGQPLADVDVATHLAMFVIQGLMLTAVVSELRAARRASDQQARVAQAARRESEAANRTKDQFLATISHELRTPLNAVLGWVHLLRTGKLDREASTRGLESIERNARLQAQLTGDLLDVSKALTGELQLETHPTTVTEAAQQAVASVEPAARAKGVAIEVSWPDAPVVVLADPPRLRQIVWHLLSNAIKFSPRGGTVQLAVESRRNEAVLTVRDSGTGIDPAFLPRIFDRFTQQDSSSTRAFGGLGVGLALVRELVTLHGGEIDAHNRHDAAGAVFKVRLPLQSAKLLSTDRLDEPSPPVPGASQTPLEGLRVLVLEQDLDGREMLRTMLHQRGANVQTVGSVAEALESLERWRPDVLISDAASPAHDSYALVGKIQSLDAERGGRIPALALTTFARSDTRLGQMIAEVQRDVPKPVEAAVLTAEIARLAGREGTRARRLT